MEYESENPGRSKISEQEASHKIPSTDRDRFRDRPFVERRRMSDSPTDPDNPTFQRIIQAITEHGGYIPYSQFMELSSPVFESPEREAGEPTTPEHLTLFARTIGRQLVNTWDAMGRPATFQTIELLCSDGAFQKAIIDSVAESSDPKSIEFAQALDYRTLTPRNVISMKDSDGEESSDENIATIKLPYASGEITGAFISNGLVQTLPFDRAALINGQLRQLVVSVDPQGRFFEEWQEPTEEVKRYIENHAITIREKVEEPIALGAEKLQKEIDRTLRRGIVITIGEGKKGQVGSKGMQSPIHFLRTVNPDTQEVSVFDHSTGGHDEALPYQNLGNVEIRTAINFKPLATTPDTLKTDFLGPQAQFLWRAGINEERARIVPRMSQATSIAEILSLSREYTTSMALTEIDAEGGNNHVLMQSKDISLKLPPLPKGLTTRRTPDFRFQLRLGSPGEKITLSSSETSSIIKPYELTIGTDGILSLDLRGGATTPPHSLFTHQYVLTNEQGDIVFDSKNPDLAKKVLEESGYTVDVPI